MKQRRKELIESAIKLFAEKGFQSTSVQDIVSSYGISKGAFYNYFSSKEELLIAIFKYYNEKLSDKIVEVDSQNLSPREMLKKQIQIQFKYFMKHRDFIVMYFREQNQSINEELRRLLNENTLKMLKREEELLLSAYGDSIQPYIKDLVLICTGFRNAYMKITVFDGVSLDPERISSFLMERIDDIVSGLKNCKPEPLLTEAHFKQFTADLMNDQDKITENLMKMNEILERIEIPQGKKEDLQNAIVYLIEESKKTDLKKYIFQGMLTNFKSIEQLDVYRKEIADILDIDLL
jgi:AcrR family transcriptional regulator